MKHLTTILLLLCAGCAGPTINSSRIDSSLIVEASRPAPVPFNAGEVIAALPKYESREDRDGIAKDTSESVSISAIRVSSAVTWTWNCQNTWAQTFQFISTTNLVNPVWTVVTNVVGTNFVTLPNRYQHEYLTIGATWFTGDRSVVKRWEGWK